MNAKCFLILTILFTFTFNSFADQKTIYGKDDRDYVTSSSKYYTYSKSVAAILFLPEDQVSSLKKNGFSINSNAPTLNKVKNLCPGERFSSDVVMASCTGFLIAPDVLATAGHCIKKGCKSLLISFDFYNGVRNFGSDKVFSCKEIISYDNSGDQDYALIRLDREATGRTPFQFDSAASYTTRLKDPVAILGHPDGTAMKYANNATIKEATSTRFLVDLDSFHGNSGSPVINERTGRVVGVFVSGPNDYVQVGTCNKAVVCTDANPCSLSALDPFINNDGVTSLFFLENLSMQTIRGDLGYVKSILSLYQINLNIRDSHGNTVLHYAAEKNRVDIAQLLIERGASIEVVNDRNKTPVHTAIEAGNLEIVRTMLDRNTDSLGTDRLREYKMYAKKMKQRKIKKLIKKYL